MVKNLPPTKETGVLYLGREDLLEKGMVIHSNILTMKVPCTEVPGELQSMVIDPVYQSHNQLATEDNRY